MLAVTGWGGLANRGESVLPLTAMLRSWEDEVKKITNGGPDPAEVMPWSLQE